MDEAFEGTTWEALRERVGSRLDAAQLRRLEALFRMHELLREPADGQRVESVLDQLEREFDTDASAPASFD